MAEARAKDIERFLERELLPDGEAKLIAIYPDKSRKVLTKSFGAPESAAHWASDQTKAGMNVYWTVQIGDGTRPKKKDTKETIAKARFLAVDIDCGSERVGDQISRLVGNKHKRPKDLPEPSFVICSGNGVWPVWRIEPVDVTELEERELVEDVQRGLAKLLGGDSCHNIDRIARLPGTVNFPDKKKKEKGAIEQLAKVVAGNKSGQTFRIDDFLAFAISEDGPAMTSSEGKAAVEAPCTVADLSDLGLSDDDPLAAAIVNLVRPSEMSTRDGEDRSEVVFYVACELTRRGVAPGKIAGALLNRDWEISKHIYEKGGRQSELYAQRQVQRAAAVKEATAKEALKSKEPPPKYVDARLWLNHRYATIENYGGKYRVMARPGVDDPKLPMFLEDLQWARRFHGFMTKIVGSDGKPELVPLGRVWLNDRKRARFSRVVFDPSSEESDDRTYNLWTGFYVPNDATACDDFLELTKDVIAAGDEDVAEYLLNWMALRVQCPGMKMETAIALRGGQGLGKSLWVELFGELFGSHFVAVSGAHGLASNFNKHLQQALLVFGDEMDAAGDKAMVSRLKTLVTQTHIQIEPKGVDSFSAPNRFAVIVASNDDRVVKIDPDDRRWLVLDVGTGWKGDLDRFEALVSGWRSGGREAFLELLLSRDLSDFNHRRRPITATHTDQVRRSFGGAMGAVHALLDRGETPPVGRGREEYDCPTRSSGEVFVPTGDFLRWAQTNRLLGAADGNIETALGRELAMASLYRKTIRISIQGRQTRGVWLAPLSDARKRWAEAHGLRIEWSEAQAGWDIAPAGPDVEVVEKPDEEVPF